MYKKKNKKSNKNTQFMSEMDQKLDRSYDNFLSEPPALKVHVSRFFILQQPADYTNHIARRTIL